MGGCSLLYPHHNCANPEPVISSLRKRIPSIICVAGDLVYARAPETGLLVEAQEKVLPLLRGCVDIAPTFMSLGNHESFLCDEDISLIRKTGVTVLDNGWSSWNGIHIGGLTSHYVLDRRAFRAAHPSADRYPTVRDDSWENKKEPDVSWLKSPLPSGCKVLLCHHPEYLPLIPPEINLICAAHAHGGQWRIAGRGLFAPGQGWFPKYTSGICEGRMVVTRGLTNMARVPRINNPTEIVYITC